MKLFEFTASENKKEKVFTVAAENRKELLKFASGYNLKPKNVTDITEQVTRQIDIKNYIRILDNSNFTHAEKVLLESLLVKHVINTLKSDL